MTSPTARPAFTGLDVYRDLDFRYSFLYPTGWHRSEMETDAGRGIIVAPLAESTETSFSVAARDVSMTVSEDDLPDLRAGFEAGLTKYMDLAIEKQDAFAIGALIGVEAIFTYRAGDATRKRWVRVLYQGTTMARIIAQGADVQAYAYWEPMLTQAMRTFQFADWWAEVTGTSWLSSLDAEPDSDDGPTPLDEA